MANTRLEKFFRHPWIIVAAVLALTVFFGAQLPKLIIDNSIKNFLNAHDPTRLAEDRLERLFGKTDRISLTVQAKHGTLFTPARLEMIARLTRRLEAIPHVKEVVSLANADLISGGEGVLRAEKLMPAPPRTPAQVRELESRLASWDLFRGFLYSQDLRTTQLVIELNTRKAAEETVRLPGGGTRTRIVTRPSTVEDDIRAFRAIQKTIADNRKPDLEYYLTGSPAVLLLITQGIKQDMVRLVPVVTLVLVLTLFLAFRRWIGVLLPALTVGISCLWTVGLIALLGVRFTIMSSAIPVLLVAVGSAYGIHFMSHYYDHLGASPATRRDIVITTVGKIGPPVFWAAVTTMIGFGALATSNLVIVQSFGLFTAVGVAAAALVSLVFIPALLLLRDGRGAAPVAHRSHPGTGIAKLLAALERAFLRRRLWVMLSAGVLVLVSLWGIRSIKVGGEMVNYFKAHTDVRRADAFVNRHLNGTTVLSLLIEGLPRAQARTAAGAAAPAPTPAGPEFSDEDFALPGEATPAAGGPRPVQARASGPAPLREVTDPRLLQALDDLDRDLRREFTSVKQVASLADMVKRMNFVMHDGAADFDEIPTRPAKYHLRNLDDLRRLIAQYLLLYSGNLDAFMTPMDRPTYTRVTVQMTDGSPAFLHGVKAAIADFARRRIEPLGFKVSTAGYADMSLAVNDYILRTQVTSIALSLLLVFLLVSFSQRSWAAGAFGLVPLVAALLVNFGCMGIFGITLDVGTALVASVSIGIGIDYAIHWLTAFRRERRAGGDPARAVQRTMLTTGKAIVFNAASVAAGFAVLMFSHFIPLIFLGLLVGLTMLTSAFAALTLLPALLDMFKPRFISAARSAAALPEEKP